MQPVSLPRAWQTVHRAWYRGRELQKEDFKEERVEVPTFTGPVGHVSVAGGVTRNMGDFNNVKVYVSVSLPCYPEDTEVRRAYMHASTLIDELLPSELDKAMGVDNVQG